MGKVIITELNYKNGYKDFYSAEHKYVNRENETFISKIKKRLLNDRLSFPLVSDFEEFSLEIIAAKQAKVIIFANFPADETYKRYRLESNKDATYYKATGYKKTFSNFKSILNINDNIDLYIITGASSYSLSDSQIKDLSMQHNIRIQRKKDWLCKSDSYQSLYEDYVYEILRNI